MDVLVLGGTGLIGRALVPELLARGHRVTILSRGRRRPEWWDRIAHIEGERRSFQVDRSFDAVVDNLAYDAADADHAMAALRGRTAHYLLTSTMGVYNYWEFDRPVREEDVDLTGADPRPFDTSHNAYALGKRNVERAVHRANPAFAVTVFRPPIVEGPFDNSLRTWFWIKRIADGGPVLLPVLDRPSFIRNVWSHDLARAYATALERPAGRRVFNVGMAETLTPRRYVNGIARGMGRPVRVVEAPVSAIHARVKDYHAPQWAAQVLDTTRVERELGFRATPFDQWMPHVTRWHMDHADLSDPPGYERRSDEVAAAEFLAPQGDTPV